MHNHWHNQLITVDATASIIVVESGVTKIRIQASPTVLTLENNIIVERAYMPQSIAYNIIIVVSTIVTINVGDNINIISRCQQQQNT